MKEFLNKHYEKFLFGFSILALGVIALLCFDGAKFLISTFNVATSEIRAVDQAIIFDTEKAEQVGIQRR
jgi:hypothetical protein